MLDAQKAEVAGKFAALAAARFGGDPGKMFAYFDADGDGKLDAEEVRHALAEAGVGTPLTRRLWAAGIVQHADADGDGKLTYAEIEALAKKEGG